MTHAQLVEAARTWLRDAQRCAVVITEMVTAAAETPDAIGWRSDRTILVECKASRADFRADAKKWCRVHAHAGMGDYRFFAAPSNVILAEELPTGWGLLELSARGLTVTRKSHSADCFCDGLAPRSRYVVTSCRPFAEKNARNEATMLLSLIRRLKGVGVRGKACVDVNPYTRDEHGNELHAV